MSKSPYKVKALTIDSRGRITIPGDVRKATGINPDSNPLAIYVEGENYIVIVDASDQYLNIADKTMKEIKNSLKET